MRIVAHRADGAGSYFGGRLARAGAGVRFIAQQHQPWDRAAGIVTILLVRIADRGKGSVGSPWATSDLLRLAGVRAGR